MEGRLQADFSRVRVHDGQAAAASAQALGARAYTRGEHIVLGEPAAPRSTEGRRVWAHELAHVRQNQAGGAARATPQALTLGASDDPAEVEAERLADHATRPGMSPDGAAAGLHFAGPPGVVRRLLFVRDPGQRPTHEPSLAGRTNAAWVQEWLRTLCPEAGATVDGTTGAVTLPPVAPGATDPCAEAEATVASQTDAEERERTRLERNPAPPRITSAHPVSCQCLCRAVRGPTRIDLSIGDTFSEPARQGTQLSAADRSVERAGGGVTLQPDGPVVVPNPRVVVSGRGRRLPGADPDAPQRRTVDDPAWLILSHELCGHVLHDPAQEQTDAAANWPSHVQTEEGRRSTVDIENQIRGEHGLGVRGVGFGLYRLQAGDDAAALERRFGVVLRGLRAWELDRARGVFVHHNLVFHGSEDPEIDQSTMSAAEADRVLDEVLATHGERAGEISLRGVSWDTVRDAQGTRPRDTWASIAARWGVGPRGRRSGADRVRDANDGITLLLHPGARVIIPAR